MFPPKELHKLWAHFHCRNLFQNPKTLDAFSTHFFWLKEPFQKPRDLRSVLAQEPMRLGYNSKAKTFSGTQETFQEHVFRTLLYIRLLVSFITALLQRLHGLWTGLMVAICLHVLIMWHLALIYLFIYLLPFFSFFFLMPSTAYSFQYIVKTVKQH